MQQVSLCTTNWDWADAWRALAGLLIRLGLILIGIGLAALGLLMLLAPTDWWIRLARGY